MIRKLPKFLTEDQMVALACHPEPRTLLGARDRAILGVLLAAGLRASELCGLQVRDVRAALLFVRRGKFGHQRWVAISRRCQAAIARYLAIHPAQPGDPLFRTLGGRQLTRRQLHKLVTAHQRGVGLAGGVHLLRASAATRWLNHGLSLSRVQFLLGHVNIGTTALYLGVATDAMVRDYQAALDGVPVAVGR